MAGLKRSTARGESVGLTRLRSREWSAPLTCRMLCFICSYSGPSPTPKISAIFMPGKIAERVRRKNSPASRSSVM